MRLREWLDRNSRSAAWLGRRIGVTRAAVHAWIAGYNRPDAENLAKIAEVTKDEVRPRDFVDGPDHITATAPTETA